MKTEASQLADARKAGIALKKLHDAELVDQGEGIRALPRSVGQVYDIPPDNGTYTPDKVDQTGKDFVDVNQIMKRYEKTGKLEELIALGMSNKSGQFYGDFTSAPTFQEALNISIHAQDQFNLLDAPIRNRFDNDPVKFLAFMDDPMTIEEQRTLGLRKRPEPTSGALVPGAAPAATPPSPASP